MNSASAKAVGMNAARRIEARCLVAKSYVLEDEVVDITKIDDNGVSTSARMLTGLTITGFIPWAPLRRKLRVPW